MSKLSFYIILGIALTATSFASIFILLTPTSPLVIAFWRMLLATIGTIFLAKMTGQIKDFGTVNKLQIKYLAFSGLFLALHFATWIMSLFYTTIAESLILVDSSPVIVLILAAIFLNERINKIQFMGITISICGGILIAIGSLTPNSQASDPLLGNLLAFSGAITISGYIIIGRIFRKVHEMGLFVYTAYVYGFSTIILFFLALIFETSELINSLLGKMPIQAYLLFFLLAGISTLLGHSLYNFALKEVKATIVSMITLGEPIISSILAVVFFQQYPTSLTVIGGSIVIFGVLITIIFEKGEEIISKDLIETIKTK